MLTLYNEHLGKTYEEFMEEHHKMMMMMWHRYKKLAVNGLFQEEDVLQHCRIGMFSAYKMYNPNDGWALSTIMGNCIRFEIQKAIRRSNPSGLNISRPAKEFFYKYILPNRDDVTPDNLDKWQKEAGVSDKTVATAMFMTKPVGYLDAPVRNDMEEKNSTLKELLVSTEVDGSLEELVIQRGVWGVFMSSLSELETKVVTLSAREMTQSEVAKEIGISQAHVSRLLRKLRKKYKDLEV